MVNLLPENINAVLTTTCACTVAVLVTESGIVQNLKLGSVPTTPVLTQILVPTLILTTPAPISTPKVPMPMPNPSRPSLTITPSTPTQVPSQTLAPKIPTLTRYPGTPNLTLDPMIDSD